jgi:aspartyl-tRNA synthetase
MLRTHTCNELSLTDVPKDVALCGWVAKILDHGAISFIHLRDRYGIVQLVTSGSISGAELHLKVSQLKREDCILATGVVRAREEKDISNHYATGTIEIVLKTLKVLGAAETPPFEVGDKTNASDELRLKYRYLDLRGKRMQQNIIRRHEARDLIRASLIEQGFLEIETPLFVRSTPEGARDYVVPSRVHKGRFYALPQSPQLYKQLLMVSGFDRYFQFATCFRDEDLRADRAQFFTQIDLEMSFATEEDIFSVNEAYLKKLFQKMLGITIESPFPRMTHAQALLKYGTDKPDLRFGCEMREITSWFHDSPFQTFSEVAKAGGMVKVLRGEGCAKYSRKQIEALEAEAKLMGAAGLAFTKVTESGLEGGIGKFLQGQSGEDILQATGAKNGDLLLFGAGKPSVVNAALDRVRNVIGVQEGWKDRSRFQFTWVTDFPLFEFNPEEKRWDPSHHVFCKPSEGTLHLLDSDPGKVVGRVYDLVLNGMELLSGSIRINEPQLQKKIFEVIGLSEQEAASKFGFLLEAFRFGAPPHGGSALGFDRLVAILCGEDSIKDVIAFPNSASGTYPLDGSPSTITHDQLQELGLKLL